MITKTCPKCGKEFSFSTQGGSPYTRKFCSRECGYSGQGKRIKIRETIGVSQPEPITIGTQEVEITCRHCGKKAVKKMTAWKMPVYCSQECQREHQHGPYQPGSGVEKLYAAKKRRKRKLFDTLERHYAHPYIKYGKP